MDRIIITVEIHTQTYLPREVVLLTPGDAYVQVISIAIHLHS
jgi:hypothetical protein